MIQKEILTQKYQTSKTIWLTTFFVRNKKFDWNIKGQKNVKNGSMWKVLSQKTALDLRMILDGQSCFTFCNHVWNIIFFVLNYILKKSSDFLEHSMS